jgi:hypothetical protein
MTNDEGSTAVLDADIPMESHAKPMSKHEKVHSGLMNADDTDKDTETETTGKGIALYHRSKGIEISQKADNKMAKKDKASESIKKEFKHQMDLTKNIGQEIEPKVAAKPVAKHAVKQ